MDSVLDTGGWYTLEEYDFDLHEDYMDMETTGYCVKCTNKSVFIAQSVGNGKISSIVSIPSVSIKSIIKMNKE